MLSDTTQKVCLLNFYTRPEYSESSTYNGHNFHDGDHQP